MNWIQRGLAVIFDFLQGIVAIAAVMVMIYLFVMSPQEISGSSMEPNFHNGEYILTNKIIYRFVEPKRGDVVVFESPKNPEVDYIKRILGMPGESVVLSAGQFSINGMLLEEPYDYNKPVYGASFIQEGVPVEVPEGYYFVVGDNRPGSSDSREFGFIAKEAFIGKAILRYWPLSNMGLIPKPAYAL